MNIEIIYNKDLIEIWVSKELSKKTKKKYYQKYLGLILQMKSEKELNNLFLNIDIKIARKIIYRLLSMRGYMSCELEKKLKLNLINTQAIEIIIKECKELGYIDDAKEGELFIEKQKRKGLGPYQIQYRLKSKAPHLKNLVKISEDEEALMIKNWIDKKTKNQNFNDIHVKQKLFRFFINKGFREELVRQLLFI